MNRAKKRNGLIKRKCRALAKTRSLAHWDEASGGSERQKPGSGRGERDIQESLSLR